MTSSIFETWLSRLDRKLMQKRIILIIVDNCSAHPKLNSLQSINFCHQTVPVSVIQPLDQGIIRLFKFHYRKFSLKSIGDCIDLQNKKPTEALSRITKMAWNKVLKESFKNCFHHGFYGSSKDAPDDASQETVELQQVHQQADVTDVTSGMFHIFSWIYF